MENDYQSGCYAYDRHGTRLTVEPLDFETAQKLVLTALEFDTPSNNAG